MTMSRGEKKVVFKKLENNLYYLEGKLGGNATEVNGTVWEDLSDEDMPTLFDRTFGDDSDNDGDSEDTDDGMPELDSGSESSSCDESDSDFSVSDLNVFTSVFMDNAGIIKQKLGRSRNE